MHWECGVSATGPPGKSLKETFLQSLPYKHRQEFFFFFWPSHAACKILVPRLGMEPQPLAMRAADPTTGRPGNSPIDRPHNRIHPVTLFALCVCVKLHQSCLTLCSPTDCSLPGSSVPGILQARILEWVAMPSSRGSSPGI